MYHRLLLLLNNSASASSSAALMSDLNAMASQLSARNIGFLFVYIAEAHPVDEWPVSDERPCIELAG